MNLIGPAKSASSSIHTEWKLMLIQKQERFSFRFHFRLVWMPLQG